MSIDELRPEESAALVSLTARVRSEIEYFGYYAKPWVKPAIDAGGQPVHDVVIIGAGQNGLGIYHGLRQNGISRCLIIDENSPQSAGNFAQYDRMLALRTPKDLTGLDYGLASLTFRSFWEALYPERDWDSLEKVGREDWSHYLQWYRDTLEIPVQYEHALVRLERENSQTVRVIVKKSEGAELIYYTRSVVIATGFQAETVKRIPMDIIGNTSESLWAHGADPIDFSALRGKRIAILGHGAGSFDSAAMALEAGAAAATVYYRRKSMPRVNPFRKLELAGLMANFHELDEETRWKIAWLVSHRDQPAPELAMRRVADHPGFSVQPGVGWTALKENDAALEILLSNGETESADFAIFATGFERRPLERPELQSFAAEISTWENFEPPAGYESAGLSGYPRHGSGYELLPNANALDSLASHIFNFSFSSGLDHGPHITSISGIRFSLQRIVTGVSSLLTRLDEDAYFEDFSENPSPEAYLDDFPEIIG
ncbi:MAG: NAD(P)-binding domain-containing protein [Opitutales bacterium]